MVKKLTIAIAILGCAGILRAEDPLIDIKSLLGSTRVGVFMDQHQNQLAGVYATVLSFHAKQWPHDEYVNLNVGYLKRREDSMDSPLVQVGLRCDNLLARARSSDWGRSHTTLSKLPKIEFGPFASTWLEKKDGGRKLSVLYGIGVALGF